MDITLVSFVITTIEFSLALGFASLWASTSSSGSSPLAWFMVSNYAEKVCPKCNKTSGAHKSLCVNCGGPMVHRFRTRQFKNDLRAAVGEWLYGRLDVNKSGLLQSTFSQCPEVAPYIEAKSAISLLKQVVATDLPRITNEVTDLAQSPDFGKILDNEGISRFVENLRKDAVQSLDRIDTNSPRNPADVAISQYKDVHTDYSKKRIEYQAKVKQGGISNDDLATAKQAGEQVATSLAKCTRSEERR